MLETKNMIDEEVLGKLGAIFPRERILTSPAELYSYGADASIHRNTPHLVVIAHSTAEVSALMKLANEYRIPVTPRGAGTAMCGHAVPVRGGIILDLQQMKKIKEIHVEDFYVIVEPGVVYAELNKALKSRKFYFPPDPGSGEACTIGGMVVCNASGVHAVKYGATRDYLLGAEVVLPTGEIVKLGTKTLKSASGYQFERLLPASEGTLGIVTEITLKVIPVPKANAMAVAAFDRLETAGQFVSNLIAYPVLPAALELMDNICIKAINKAMKLGLPEAEAICFVEVDGHPAAIKDEIEDVAKVARETGAISVEFTHDPKKIEELQKGRKGMIPSLSKYRSDLVTVMLADDMAVPISQVPKAVKAFHKIAEKHGVLIPTYGHAGDGNLHTKFLIDPTKRLQWEAAEKATAEVYEVVLGLGGTVTGEHGVSITKAPFYRKERADVLELSRSVKRAFDPNNILNPGKMMDWEEGIISHLRYPIPYALKETYPELKKHEWDMLSCTYCGFCKSVCPVFTQVLQDSCVARGKVVLSYGILSGALELDSQVAERIFQCTGCMDCTRRCPSGIAVVPMVEAARAELVRAGFSTDNQKLLVKNILESGNIYGDPTSFVPGQEGEVLIFVGCQYASRMNMTKKILKTLGALGVKGEISKETCCGFPMKNMGFLDELARQKEKFLSIYRDRTFYALCPTCQAFIHEEYGLDCKHILSFIESKLTGGEHRKADGVVTYHDPCHLSRIAGIIETPRNILRSLGYTINEMEFKGNQSRCCGGGGGILVTDPSLSDKIARDRIRQSLKTAARTLVTPCPTCEITLKKAAQASSPEDGQMQVKNLWDLIFQSVR